MTQIAEFGTPTPSRGRQIKFTPERIQQIKNLVERGKRREEIAELVGTTEGAARVHYHNAMRAVKEYLDD